MSFQPSDETISRALFPIRPQHDDLTGERIRLTRLKAAHAESLFAAYAQDTSAESWRYLPYGPYDTIEDLRAWIYANAPLSDPHFYAVIDSFNQRALGIVSYLRIQPEAYSIEVGHIHFSPSLRKTVMATEAMFLMMRWVFERGYRRYEWKCDARNHNSRRAAQRLGFSYEGIFRQANVVKGKNRDTAWFSCIDKEWSQLRQCYETFLNPQNFDVSGKQINALSQLTHPYLATTDPMLSAF